MKKILVYLIISLMILPTILAINIDVNKKSSNEVLIKKVNEPSIFELEIINYGPADELEFYNLVGFYMVPSKISIDEGETKSIELKISPIGEFKHEGYYTLSYFIRGKEKIDVKEELTFRAIELKDAFKIGSGDINSESNSIEIYIQNKFNIDFKELNLNIDSVFFDLKKDISLDAYEKKSFEVQLNKEDFKKLMAGFYTINAQITTKNQTAEVEGVIKFIEKSQITTNKEDYGLIINTQIIEKINEGNILAKSETLVAKNIISRLFTTLNPHPDIVEREGFTIYYTWHSDLKPGEEIKIIVKTNWFFPILLIFFIITITIFIKQYIKTDLILRKRVAFVKTKGGEFALKISIIAKARRYVERVNLVDKLPPLVKLYERFGGEKPHRIDSQNKRIEWNFENLEQGESRIVSYIIYSKVGVMGKFALPKATALYEKEGDIKEIESNRTFFVTEPKKKDIEDF